MKIKFARYCFPVLLVSLVLGCASDSLSERDQKLNQRREAAERKRNELLLVSGEYSGTFKHSTGTTQRVCLNLEIKDIPEAIDGELDPIMIPTLSGSLRFNYGSCIDSHLYISFAILKADYNPSTQRLDIVVENSEYKQILISFKNEESTLKGAWTAQHLGASGTADLSRGREADGQRISGSYGALLWRRDGYYQFGEFTLRTSLKSPDSFNISGVWKVIFGAWESNEYLTYIFDRIDFNPITGRFSMKADGRDLSFTGTMDSNGLAGDWSSTAVPGRIGPFNSKKEWVPERPAHGELVGSLMGSYRGVLENVSGFHYPRRVMINLVTTRDFSEPSGLKVSGNLRLYQGEFGSTLYYEYPFSVVRYFPFNFRILPETEKVGDEKFALDAVWKESKISGPLTLLGIGTVARVEVEKER